MVITFEKIIILFEVRLHLERNVKKSKGYHTIYK